MPFAADLFTRRFFSSSSQRRNYAAVRYIVMLLFALSARAACALPPEIVHDLAFGEGDERAKAIGALVASGDTAALPLLQAMIDGDMQTVGDKTVLIVKG